MKNLKDLKGVKVLTKPEQKFVTGGLGCWAGDMWCPPGSHCVLIYGDQGRCFPD